MSMIIAEIGTSHESSLEKAHQMIDAAIDSGADIIKFQWVYAKEILHPNTGLVKLPTGNIPLYQRFKDLECPVSFYEDLLNYVHKKNSKFCCSPFGCESLEELLNLNPDYIKIASPELNHYPMLLQLAKFRKKQKEEHKDPIPVIISSGVSKLSDIEKALEILGKENIFLLHCITSYPAPEDEYNLNLIENLQRIFGVPCGVSDHSLDPILVPSLSIACGGTIVEKHFTLSRETSGLDDPVALEPEQFAMMVHVIHQSEVSLEHYGKDLGRRRIIEQISDEYGKEKVLEILGNGVKVLALSESCNYGRTNRSLHYMENFSKEHVLQAKDIAVLRTEKVLSPGVSPEYLNLLIGKKLKKSVETGAGVQLSDFME